MYWYYCIDLKLTYNQNKHFISFICIYFPIMLSNTILISDYVCIV